MDTMIPITILLAGVELAIVEAGHLVVVEGEAAAVVEVVIDIRIVMKDIFKILKLVMDINIILP